MFAIAEFGSTSRNTTDKFSDRDLLIVCGSKHRKKLYNKYKERGYSISLLSPSQLYYMQKQGSLFIQHLKTEANILIDLNGELSKYLSSCELILPLASELQRCINSIQFISTWGNNDELTAWKADFLFCISRDLLIKALASQKIIAFGLETIEAEGARYLGIDKLHFQYLYKLRETKASYRSKNKIPAKTRDVIAKWIDVLAETFDISVTNNNRNVSGEYLHKLSSRKFNSPYEKLRSLEGVYLIAMRNGFIHVDHESIIKHITNPNLYGSSQVRNSHIIDKYLSDVLSLLECNPIEPKTIHLFLSNA